MANAGCIEFALPATQRRRPARTAAQECRRRADREPDAQRYADAIDAAKTPFSVSPLTIFEAATGLARAELRGNRPSTREEIVAAHAVVMAFLAANNVKEMLIGADVGRRALDAAARFGRVVGHPANLNFGDCFVYGCAKAYRVPLLLKGDDFSQTDIND